VLVSGSEKTDSAKALANPKSFLRETPAKRAERLTAQVESLYVGTDEVARARRADRHHWNRQAIDLLIRRGLSMREFLRFVGPRGLSMAAFLEEFAQTLSAAQQRKATKERSEARAAVQGVIDQMQAWLGNLGRPSSSGEGVWDACVAAAAYLESGPRGRTRKKTLAKQHSVSVDLLERVIGEALKIRERLPFGKPLMAADIFFSAFSYGRRLPPKGKIGFTAFPSPL
jgi:hypothetical protein